MNDGLRAVAAVGCGVIGAGWIARIRLNGVDVHAYDPAPEAAAGIEQVHELATTAWQELGLLPDGAAIGTLTIATSVAEAVEGADLVVESVPERIDLKHRLLKVIDAAAPADTIVTSSTSGLRPSVLAAPLKTPERFVVAHPFNPAYLVPLVEVVGGESTDPAVVERTSDLLRSWGMHPLVVRTEIDAHIADRLLEAVWREALWLVRDGIATTAEIDDAIRFGFGLRWAQMGLFETYRIAGGAGGMRHFIEQFGEALSWPWTKLTDVPELTDDLVDLIATQSDEQSGHHTVRELERIRDRNLVGILQALERNSWGAGETIAEHRRSRS